MLGLSASEEFSERLETFTEKLMEFQRVFALVNATDVSDIENLQADKESLLSRAGWINATIERAQQAVNWAQQNLSQYEDTFPNDQLGLAPLAVMAAVAILGTAIAYMGSWISDAYIWSQKAEVAREMLERGASPGEVARALNVTASNVLTQLLPFVVVGGLLWLANR